MRTWGAAEQADSTCTPNCHSVRHRDLIGLQNNEQRNILTDKVGIRKVFLRRAALKPWAALTSRGAGGLEFGFNLHSYIQPGGLEAAGCTNPDLKSSAGGFLIKFWCWVHGLG